MALGLEISIKQQGQNPKLFEPGKSSEFANFEELAQTVKDTLVITALEVLREEQSSGFEKKPRVRVDNKFGKDISAVNPFGKIEFFAKEDASKVLLGIYRAIRIRSPKVTGQYQAGNYVFVGSRLVARSEAELKQFVEARSKIGFNDKDIFRFINVNPYGRKLERYGVSKGRQKTKTRKSTKRGVKRVFANVPNGTYVLAEREIKRRFRGAFGFVKFKFHKNGGAGINIQGTGNNRTTFIKTGQPYLYPMIVFGLSSEGVARE